jgi:uncharacterized alkaline shock family protein YloU
MKLAYTLSQDISCEKVCKDIQKLIQTELNNQTDMTKKALIIDLVDVIYTDSEIIPKLEHKQDS